MRSDYATFGGCASIGMPTNGAFLKMQEMQALASQQDTYAKPAEPTQPLLFEALSRLNAVCGGLKEANGRFNAVADRILGSEQNTSGGSAEGKGGPSCAADELLGLIRSISLQVERLHEVASRVERIG